MMMATITFSRRAALHIARVKESRPNKPRAQRGEKRMLDMKERLGELRAGISETMVRL